MVNYYYVKANREEWRIPKGSQGYTDWDNFPVGGEQKFNTFTKNKLFWKNLKKGGIGKGHSSYILSKKDDKIKFTPLPRISAIAIVVADEENSHKSGAAYYFVKLKKIVGFDPIRITKEIKKKLVALPPFRLGSNRYTITKLSEQQFQKIIEIIKKDHPSIKTDLDSSIKKELKELNK